VVTSRVSKQRRCRSGACAARLVAAGRESAPACGQVGLLFLSRIVGIVFCSFQITSTIGAIAPGGIMRRVFSEGAAIGVFLTLLSSQALAQWIDYPTPSIPRTADGKPNLKAPAPRTSDGRPDFSGVWGISSGKYLMNIAADLKPDEVRPWAMESVKRSFSNLGRDSPGTNCLPNGPETIMNGSLPKKIIQTPNLIVILEETLEYRQIFLDGRPLPKDPNPSFKGYSVGRWEGDTLVVESAGFNGRNWLDVMGHPHSEELR